MIITIGKPLRYRDNYYVRPHGQASFLNSDKSGIKKKI